MIQHFYGINEYDVSKLTLEQFKNKQRDIIEIIKVMDGSGHGRIANQTEKTKKLLAKVADLGLSTPTW